MARVLAVLALLFASVSAFAPQFASTGVTRATSTTARYGYVPQGLTEAEWKKKQAEEAAAKKKNKARFTGAFTDVADWLKTMEGRQVLQGGNIKVSGHTYAKQKYATKEEYDKAKGRA